MPCCEILKNGIISASGAFWNGHDWWEAKRTIDSKKGRGTRIVLRVPLSDKEATTQWKKLRC